MNEKTLAQKYDSLKKVKGSVRGAVFLTDIKYIKNAKGKEGIKKLKEEIQKQEKEFEFDKIKNIKWYPLKWRILSVLAAKKVFNWTDKDIFEMGRSAPYNSFIVKMILRYFSFFEKTCAEAPTYWAKHYTRGELETHKYDGKKKYVIFRLKNFKNDPCLCKYLMGFFKGMAELTNRSEKITIEESKCMFEGDPYHEFIMSWK